MKYYKHKFVTTTLTQCSALASASECYGVENREIRNHRRTMEKPQHWKFETKTYHCAFLILLQQDRGHGFTTGFTTYRKYPLVEPFLSLNVYVVGIIPVCQKANILYEHMYDLLSYEHMYGFLVIWTHVWPPIIWTDASIFYEHEHMYDLLSISVIVCLMLTLSEV